MVTNRRIARVFTRQTNATPDDSLAYWGSPDLFVGEQNIDAIHVSVAFTWDIDRANQLRDEWEKIAPASIGGPAMGQPSQEFISGRYLKPGYTITSRGCPRSCWFCRVPKTEGSLRELPIVPGWKIQDDNLLACSRDHFEAVCDMLADQPCRTEFIGGLEAAILKDWHVDRMSQLKPRPICFFAYDPGDDYDALAVAARKMLAAGWTTASHRLRCYVLIGWAHDAFGHASKRLEDMLALGFTPMAMLWKHPKTGLPINDGWKKFQRHWARPAIIHAKKRMPLQLV